MKHIANTQTRAIYTFSTWADRYKYFLWARHEPENH